MIDFLNHFGRVGGFTRIEQLVQSIVDSQTDKSVAIVNVQAALPLLSTFCECLGKAAPVLHKTFAHSFIPKLLEAVKQSLLSASPD